MQTKTKIVFLAAMAFAFCYAGNAKADYWTKHTRSSSSNVLPQYLELEQMAKSSSGVRFLYGNNRVGGTGNESNWVRKLISYSGTAWTDQTAAVESAGGYSDIEFLNMYADGYGNVWMPNRKDPDVALMKYKSDGTWEKISSADIGTQTGIGGNLKIKNLFGNRNSADFMYAVATNGTRLYVLIYTHSSGVWTDSGYTGGPLLDTNNNGADFWGMYNEADQSFWFYQYHSSENQFSNPAGGDVGAGIWRYKDSTWTQYNSSDTTADGVALKNGVTEAFVDSSGDVWVGTRYGVFRFDVSAGTWANWTKDNSNIFTDRVQKIQEDEDGRIWIVSLAVETSTDPNNRGGISIYDPSSASWDYYTSKNGETALDNATNIFMIGGGSEAWMFTGHGEEAMSAGIYALTRDDAHTALYGQTSGTTVVKTNFDQQKKSSAKKVTITKKYKVKKKWRKKVVYRGKSTGGWYKKLNLAAGTNIKYIIKIQGKRTRTISASTGDPIKTNFN